MDPEGGGTGGPDPPGKPQAAIGVPWVQLLLEGGTFVWPSVNFLMTKKTLSVPPLTNFFELPMRPDKVTNCFGLIYSIPEIFF